MNETNPAILTDKPATQADTLLARTLDKYNQLNTDKTASLEAHSTPLPGPTLPAFTEGPIQIENYSIRKLVKADYRIFAQTGNSLLKWLAESSKPSHERQPPEDDPVSTSVAIWMLLRDPRTVEKTLKEDGVEVFKARCQQDIEFSLPPHIYSLLETAVWEQIYRSQITALKFMQKESEGEKSDPFTVLSALMEHRSKLQQPPDKSPQK